MPPPALHLEDVARCEDAGRWGGAPGAGAVGPPRPGPGAPFPPRLRSGGPESSPGAAGASERVALLGPARLHPQRAPTSRVLTWCQKRAPHRQPRGRREGANLPSTQRSPPLEGRTPRVRLPRFWGFARAERGRGTLESSDWASRRPRPRPRRGRAVAWAAGGRPRRGGQRPEPAGRAWEGGRCPSWHVRAAAQARRHRGCAAEPPPRLQLLPARLVSQPGS